MQLSRRQARVQPTAQPAQRLLHNRPDCSRQLPRLAPPVLLARPQVLDHHILHAGRHVHPDIAGPWQEAGAGEVQQ